ncbi:hypothetical protein EP47_01870 [Legionella norrlandica]|uniref:Tetratricopeptide repeat protein n=1 Tax=Legionella norrlandica TaxID=1498499 RepID=A0A0A2SM13_9GAMM|nr:hypothetical protein [Legionella norrlandica]KGP62190.1 hypothetical protein EP47_01870 [Legionella norrlandica]
MKKYFPILLAIIFYAQESFSDIHYKNVSQNHYAQKLFNSGMLNYYAYSYVQAEYDFRQALVYDPKCGMCYWGLALAKKQESLDLGQPFAKVGFEDIKKAGLLVSPKNEFHYDVIRAAMNSFSLKKNSSEKQLQIQFINALRQVHQKYKDSKEWRSESLALFVHAIAYYDSVNDDKIINHCRPISNNDYKQEALDLLVPVLKDKSYPDHPGLLHIYIHMAERNLKDPLGLVAAKKIPSFSHGVIAHYTHMPTHIYWRRGMYNDAIQANLNAIAIDENYFKHNSAGLNSYYYEFHFLHSHHFLTMLGVLTNNFDLAIHYARTIKNLMKAHHRKKLNDSRDIFLSLEHLVLARFNKWQEVLNLPIPGQADELAILFINFTRSLAYLKLGQNMQFQNLYDQIKNKKYTRKNMIELQTLVLSYLYASELSLKQASLIELENVFLKNHADKIEEKIFFMNPPPWFFPYQLFLSEVAAERSDMGAAKKYHILYERIYPKSTLLKI